MTYRPAYFRLDDRATLLSLIAAHPLATFITAVGGDVRLTHLPMLARLDGESVVLEGHIARANDQWRCGALDGTASFVLAQHYVSPTWYPSKQRDPATVPTYDYVAIEARGMVSWKHDVQWLRAFVERLTNGQEAAVGGTWSIGDAPARYIDSQLRAIVGVEIQCRSLTGTFKLHQNHPHENIESVIASLRALGTAEATALASFISRTKIT